MKKNIALLLTIVMLISLGLAACNNSFALDVNDITLEQYEQHTLSVNKTGDVTWSSSNTKVVQVEDGVLTTVGLGSAIITAKLDNEEDTCEVYVIPSTVNRALILSEEDTKELQLGDALNVTASLKQDGVDISGITVDWTSSKTDIATVSGGKVTGLASGTSVIYASVTYKGQVFAKSFTVLVVDNTFEELIPTMLASDTAEGSVALHIDETFPFDTIYWWTNTDVDKSRLSFERLFDSSGKPYYDYIVFNLLIAPLDADGYIVFNIGDKTIIFEKGKVVQEAGIYIYEFADPTTVFKGTIAAHAVYSVVLELTEFSGDEISIGISTGMNAFVADPYGCSKDEFSSRFDFELPIKPDTDDTKFTLGQTYVDLDAETDGDYAGWVKVPYANALWDNRVIVGHPSITSSYNIGAKYRQYEYYGFDFVLNSNNLKEIVFWTGGYALNYNHDSGVVKAVDAGATIKDTDLYFFDSAGNRVKGKLEIGKVYTIKIIVQSDNLQNSSFGFTAMYKSTTPSDDDVTYVSNPYFLKGKAD